MEVNMGQPCHNLLHAEALANLMFLSYLVTLAVFYGLGGLFLSVLGFLILISILFMRGTAIKLG